VSYLDAQAEALCNMRGIDPNDDAAFDVAKEEIYRANMEALEKVKAGLEGRRYHRAIDVLEIADGDPPYLDVTIDGDPYRLHVERM
jgi:hypothetical protein